MRRVEVKRGRDLEVRLALARRARDGCGSAYEASLTRTARAKLARAVEV